MGIFFPFLVVMRWGMRQLNSSNEYGSGSKTTKGEGGGAGFKAKKIGFSSITQMEIFS